MSYLQQGRDSISSSRNRACLLKILWLLILENSKQLSLCVPCAPLHTGTGCAPLYTVSCLQNTTAGDCWHRCLGHEGFAPVLCPHLTEHRQTQINPTAMCICLEVFPTQKSPKLTQTVGTLTSSSPPVHPVLQPLPANQSTESTADL